MSNYLLISYALTVAAVFWVAYRLRANRGLFIQTVLLGVGLVALGGLVPVLWSLAPAILPASSSKTTDGKFAKDAGSETYTLDGRTVTLTAGAFQEPYSAWLNRPRNPYDNASAKAMYLPPEPMTPGKIATVRLTDKRVVGDVSSDGSPDEAVIFTFNAGGESTYSFVTLRRTSGEWHGAATNSILLGDRVTVEAVRIENGKVFVDTLDRKPGDALSVPPSRRVTRTFQVNVGGGLDEIK